MTATSATENAALASAGRVVKFQIYRYDPDKDARPYMQSLEVQLAPTDKMLLDALMRIKSDVDDGIAFRRSCREGVCGSDAMNINGKNGLACITNLRELKEPIVLKPLPGLPVIRDLISSAGAITALNVAFSSSEDPTAVGGAVSLSGNNILGAIDLGDAPSLLFHGPADGIVPYQWAVNTVNQALAAGLDSFLTTWTGAGHVPYAQHRTEILDQTTNFLYWELDLANAAQ